MNEETLKIVEIIEFRNFKEKLHITKEFDHRAKMEIIGNKYVYVEREEITVWVEEPMAICLKEYQILM